MSDEFFTPKGERRRIKPGHYEVWRDNRLIGTITKNEFFKQWEARLSTGDKIMSSSTNLDGAQMLLEFYYDQPMKEPTQSQVKSLLGNILLYELRRMEKELTPAMLHGMPLDKVMASIEALRVAVREYLEAFGEPGEEWNDEQ